MCIAKIDRTAPDHNIQDANSREELTEHLRSDAFP